MVSSNQSSRHAGRRFGHTIGIACLVLGTASWLRGRAVAAEALWLAGGLLNLLAAIAPTRLNRLEREWMRLAWAMSRVTTPLVIGVMYFGVITPIGVVKRIVGTAFTRQTEPESYWVPRSAPRSDLRRQF
jgi:hypothetical protein